MIPSYVTGNFKWIFLSIATSIIFYSCSESDNKVNLRNYYRNDLECYDGWVGVSGIENLVTDDSHSGTHSEKTDSLNNYSITFERKLQDLSPMPIKIFNVSIWLKCYSQASKGSYVVSIENGSEILKYFSFDLKEKDVEPNKWTKLEGKCELPANLPKDAIVKIYFWNKGNTIILADDIEFSFEN